MQPVFDYLAQNDQKYLDRLLEYVRFPSVSAQPDHRPDLAACAEWLLKLCKSIGLEARLCPTAGNPVLIAKTPRKKGSRKPHFVTYGHYDVQPAEPFDLWKTKPFEPKIIGNSLFGRGASDNKGQHLAHLHAIEAYLKTGTELPCDITFVVEGEEEVGSSHLSDFLKANRKELACEAVVISDTGMPSPKHPALVYSLRGIVALEVTLRGPSRDLHSGIFGGTVDNPALVLCQLLARMRDAKTGKVTIPGFYNGVAPLKAFEHAAFEQIPMSEKEYKKFLGVPKLFGEKGYSFLEQRAARPTFEINGLTSGYQGDGSKTIIPAWARAKITCRLVPNQQPEKVLKAVTAHLKKLCPPTVTMEIEGGHAGEPYFFEPTSAMAKAALRTLKQAFGYNPIIMREGGSIPIVHDFKKQLGADSLLLGLGLPDDNAHSPNEKFDLNCYRAGMKMSAILWQELSKLS